MENKIGLAASGGGSIGAYGAGILKRKFEQGVYYDVLSGNSTGALMIQMYASKNMERLESAYTTSNNCHIMSIPPFKDNGKMDTFNVIRALYKTKFKQIGVSDKLKELIIDSLPKEDFEKVRFNGPDVSVAVTNLTYRCKEYKSIKECGYDTYIDYVFASANNYPFMNLVENQEVIMADGGYVEHIPVMYPIQKGIKDIDVIIHRPRTYAKKRHENKNIADSLLNIFMASAQETSINDMNAALFMSYKKGVTLNLYYTPYMLTENSLIFDPVEMSRWFEMGYNITEPDEIVNPDKIELPLPDLYQ